MFKILCLVLVGVLVVGSGLAMADNITSKDSWYSPNGSADGLANFLNNQQFLASSNTIYIDEPRNSVDAYLGLDYYATRNWVLGGAAFCDLNNVDRGDILESMRYEIGATYRFGPGLNK